MAVHRYWRALGFEAYGSADLELSEFHLFSANSRVDASVALTSNLAPDLSGAIGNLQDDVLATAARWSARLVKTLVLSWNFGANGTDVNSVSVAGDSQSRFPLIFKLQWSDNATAWFDSAVETGIAWPGAKTKTALPTTNYAQHVLSLSPSGYYRYEDAGAVVSDSGPNVRHGSYAGGAAASTPGLLVGGSSGEKAFRPSTTQFHTLPNSVYSGGAGFTISFFVSYSTPANTVVLERGPTNNLSVQTYGNDLGLVAGSIGFTSGQGGASVVVASNFAINDGAPHHVLIISGASLADCYVFVDGRDATQRIADRTILATAESWQVGSRSGVSGFGGVLDDLVFLARPLTTSEAVNLFYASTLPLAPRNTVRGRTAVNDNIVSGVGPALTYGATKLANPEFLGIQHGCVKDYASGVLGQGIGRVAGAVKYTPNSPVQRKVRLIRERDGLVLREAWSDPVTGAYSFDYVDELQKYTVLSYDYTGAYRAVVADGISPEVIV